MKFKALIFDFDGVLFDSEKIHLQACNQVFQSLGFTILEQEYFQKYVGLSDNEMFPLILNNTNFQFDNRQIENFRMQKIDAYKNIINDSETIDSFLDVKKFIRLSSQKIKTFAICSGATRTEIDATLEKLEKGEFKHFFTDIITIDEISKGKPSPEGYLLAAQRLNISPKYCLAIEDTQTGATAAKNAGMSVAAISAHHSDYKNVDLIAKSFKEIHEWIMKIELNF